MPRRSAGSGGSPVRSSASRRARVRRSASGAGCRPFCFELGQHEAVDRVTDPRCVVHGRQRGPLRGDERPVRLIDRTPGNPALEHPFLCIGQFLGRDRRGHELLGIACALIRDEQLAFFDIARDIAPALIASSRRSSRISAFRAALSGPWHAKQFSASIGRTSRLYSSAGRSAARAGTAPIDSTSVNKIVRTYGGPGVRARYVPDVGSRPNRRMMGSCIRPVLLTGAWAGILVG